MEAKIIKQEKNPFFHREEFLIEITADTNPGFDEVKSFLGKDENLVVVKKIIGNFGRHMFNAEVFVYDSEDAKSKIETIPKKVKKKIEEDRKKAEETKAKEEKAKQEAEAKAKAEAKTE